MPTQERKSRKEELEEVNRAGLVTKNIPAYNNKGRSPTAPAELFDAKKKYTGQTPQIRYEEFLKQPEQPKSQGPNPESSEVQDKFGAILNEFGFKDRQQLTQLFVAATNIFENAKNPKDSQTQVKLSDEELLLFTAYCSSLNAANRSNSLPTIDLFYPNLDSHFSNENPSFVHFGEVHPDVDSEFSNENPYHSRPETVFDFPNNVYQPPEIISGEVDREILKVAERAMRKESPKSEDAYVDFGAVYPRNEELPIQSNPDNLAENIFNAHKDLNNLSISYWAKKDSPEEQQKIKQGILHTLTTLSQLNDKLDKLETAEQQKIYKLVKQFDQRYEKESEKKRKNIENNRKNIEEIKSSGNPSAKREEALIRATIFNFGPNQNPLAPKQKP